MRRRGFLKVAGLAAGATALCRPRFANASWGDVPASVWAAPPDLKVLEIHLLGGVAPFESFYFRPGPGPTTRGFDTEVTDLVWNSACPNSPAGLEVDPTLFANDSNTKEIRLGPFAKPLWRHDIRDRMRVVVLSHDLLPHEAAIPFTLTGLRLGNPNQASLGAAIAQRYQTIAPRALPYAYGLIGDTTGGPIHELLNTTMSSFGRHPGSARPLVLKIGPGFATFISQLQRGNMTAAKDALLDQYRGQYRDWLRFHGAGTPTRSSVFRDYDSGAETLHQAAAISTFLNTIPTTIPSEEQCAHEPSGTFSSRPNPTRAALQAAAFLLTRPVAERARYVCVMDGGIEPRGGLPYDVHAAGHAGDTGSNLRNVFEGLASIIHKPGDPPDPNKIDLNDTLIIINTEFGRTPCKSFPAGPPLGTTCNTSSMGRDHWPQAFVNVLIGGPINTRAVVGSISEGAGLAGTADISYGPTDVRAAALVAAGINPFEAESYALGNLTSSLTGLTHEAAMINLRNTILGVSAP